tara:strand:- start:264 stop:521 length:258 start_codon:yes stop_codon:yes gene_type:complete
MIRQKTDVQGNLLDPVIWGWANDWSDFGEIEINGKVLSDEKKKAFLDECEDNKHFLEVHGKRAFYQYDIYNEYMRWKKALKRKVK